MSERSEAGPAAEAAARSLAQVVRNEWPKVVATLVRDLGDLAAAEDATQEAVEVALRRWPDSGIPDRPGAWIVTAARRKAIDNVRRDRTGRDKSRLLVTLTERLQDTPAEHALDEDVLRDDQLRLIYGCCHPALNREAQIALTLRSVAGLTTPEIARAFLVPEATLAQRLVRAKRKISTAVIPFTVPPDSELLERTSVVRSVIYLVFNEGYGASEGDDLVRVDLCDEAIRLGRLLVELMPDDAESLGLLALMLLSHSRRHARVDGQGDLILLSDQDRATWDRSNIDDGIDALRRAARLERPGPLQLQAAIQAEHTMAPTAGDTDWAMIEKTYRHLLTFTPTAVVRLNHAVAAGEAEGPERGLELLTPLADELDGYRHFHAARAAMLRRLDDPSAGDAYRRALELTGSEPERRFLEQRLSEL